MTPGINLLNLHRRIVNCGLVFCFALSLCLLPQAIASQQVQSLATGQPIERELAKGETHVYQIALAAGQCVVVTLDQLRITASLRLHAPDGKLLAHVTDWTEGSKSLWWMAETSGNYRLEIYSNDKRTAARRYRVSIELRPATTLDHRHVAAQQTFREALELFSLGDAQSRRNAISKFHEALALWRELDDQRQQAAALHELAIAHTELSEYQQALDYGRQALGLRTVAADRNWEAVLLNHLGEAYHYLGEYQQALAAYD